MSDYLPLEIQVDILRRLPAKSLIQFRSVSKAWKDLTDSPEFIAGYSVRHTHPQHLLIRYGLTVGVENRYICYVDDDTFPQQRSAPTVPLSIERLHQSRIVGSSGGLLCLFGYHPRTYNPGSKCRKRIVVLWNPLIRKSVSIDLPNVKYNPFLTVLGFGVCPVTSDPKIVQITHEHGKNSIHWKVKLYTLSSREWRILSVNLPHHSIEVRWDQVVIDKFIYWLALDRIAIKDGLWISYTIISFDMSTNEFGEVYLPDSLTRPSWGVHPNRETANNMNQVISMAEVSISKVWEFLAVLEYSMDADKRICSVWMMENDVPKSFTKLFTIMTPHASIKTLGFRKSGEPIMTTLDDLDDYFAEAALVVYEPHSKRINDIGISGTGCSFCVNSYMETLLLLNQ